MKRERMKIKQLNNKTKSFCFYQFFYLEIFSFLLTHHDEIFYQTSANSLRSIVYFFAGFACLGFDAAAFFLASTRTKRALLAAVRCFFVFAAFFVKTTAG